MRRFKRDTGGFFWLLFFDGLVIILNYTGFVILVEARIQQFQYVRDAGFVIPDLIRDRHDENNSFYEVIFSFPGKKMSKPRDIASPRLVEPLGVLHQGWRILLKTIEAITK